MREGWRCPGCGTCYAPWMPKCEKCPREVKAQPLYPAIEIPQCDHDYDYSHRYHNLKNSSCSGS